jgi:tetratricopeptide (TPR) repeat protein
MAPCRQVLPRAREVAGQALALDPESVEALSTIANVQAQHDRDYARAMTSWGRALALDPRHTRARCERALWGLASGVHGAEEAVAEVRCGVSNDPLNAWALGMQSLVLGLAERHEESIAAAQRAVAADDRSFFANWNMLRSLAWVGEHARAVQLAPSLYAIAGRHPWTLGVLAGVHAGLGEAVIARAIYHELDGRSRVESAGSGWAASAAAAAGLADEAMRLAWRAARERDPFAVLARVIPMWAPLRRQPEFGALLGELGLSGDA